ncbi:probable G-protein coupled receptor Mth-like 10 isoform X1 [Anoplolepis gracilipes]|uniref:probable G-protein coupled receptor Mth-like 10 isoform X1 n=1 Tax=Anoplolepis gracilipes TaxID=354296 RepID=UPI003BA2AB1F
MMCGNNLLLWYCIFLIIVLSSELRANSEVTSDEKESDSSTVRYELDGNTIRKYDDKQNLYTLRAHSTKNHKDIQMSMEFPTNSTDADDKKNPVSREIHINMDTTNVKNDSMSHDFFKNRDDIENNLVSHEKCDNITCIRLCCPLGKRLINGKCIAGQGNQLIFLKNIFIHVNYQQDESKRGDEALLLIVHDPCPKTGHYLIDSNLYNYQFNLFLADGSVYLPYFNLVIDPKSYCLAVMDQNRYDVNVCFNIMEEVNKIINNNKAVSGPDVINTLAHVGVMLPSLSMFIVYSIVPELRNIQGFILRGYSSLVFMGYIIELMNHLIKKDVMGYSICVSCAFFKYYAFLGSYFWLNVFNFDIWRTFRQFRPLETNAKRQEKKKLIMYSLYAYGGPFILVIFCGIMEFVPGLPKNLTRPEFDIGECWFHDGMANLLYFYVIILISVISNVCLSICTARKIAHYEKDDTYHLKNSESGRYNDNKQWFKLTVKLTKVLFIINCIKSYVLIISAMYEDKALTIWYSFVALDFIQHFYIFIIFVCKKNVKQLLLKQFGY